MTTFLNQRLQYSVATSGTAEDTLPIGTELQVTRHGDGRIFYAETIHVPDEPHDDKAQQTPKVRCPRCAAVIELLISEVTRGVGSR